jgi:hypothetical protein
MNREAHFLANSLAYAHITWQKGKNMTDLPVTNTKNWKQFPGNLKFFSLRAKHTKKYLFCLILIIVLTIPIFSNKILSHVKADASSSFSFTAGGDIG